jgi:hypothetical protein
MGRTIANGLGGVNLAQLQDFSLQANDLGHGVGAPGSRIHAVERDSGAAQIEVVGGAQEDARGVGQTGGRRRQPGPRRGEGAELFGIDGMLRGFGGNKVAHHQPQVDALEARGFAGERVQLGGRQAQAVHARIHVQRRGQGAPRVLRRGAPGVDLAQAVERGPDLMAPEVPCRPGGQTIEDVDRGLRQSRPQLDRLAKLGREEDPCAGPRERRGDQAHPQAIGVGLDHGGAVHPAQLLLQAPVVGLDRVQVDGQDGVGPRRRRARTAGGVRKRHRSAGDRPGPGR